MDPGDTCLDPQTLAGTVSSWLGEEQVDGRVQVQVWGSRGVVGFRLLQAHAVVAERTFDPAPEACPDLHAVVGLAIAMAIDANVLESIGIPAPEPGPAAEPEPEPDPDPEPATPDPEPASAVPPPTEPTKPDTPAPAARLGIAGVLEPAFLVEVAPGLGVGGRARVELGPLPALDIRMGLEVGYAPPQPFPGADGSLDALLVAGRVDLCGAAQLRRVRLRGCAGAAAGALHGRGRDFTEDAASTLPWMAVVIGVDGAISVGARAFIGFGADGYIPIVRPRFTVVGSAPGAEATRAVSPIGGAFFVGPGLRFR